MDYVLQTRLSINCIDGAGDSLVVPGHTPVVEDDVRQPDFPARDPHHLQSVIISGVPRQLLVYPFLMERE